MDIPGALRHMIRAGETTATLAEGVGVTRRSVQRWLAGQHTPSQARLAAIHEYLDHLQRVAAAGTRSRDEWQHEVFREARLALRTPQEQARLDGLVAEMVAEERDRDTTRVLVRNRNGKVVDSHEDPTSVRPGLVRPSTTTVDLFELFADHAILAPLPF